MCMIYLGIGDVIIEQVQGWGKVDKSRFITPSFVRPMMQLANSGGAVQGVHRMGSGSKPRVPSTDA